eukprot:scaffold647_cov411-Prasinococcus_capsulatus_cf.AAC.10
MYPEAAALAHCAVLGCVPFQALSLTTQRAWQTPSVALLREIRRDAEGGGVAPRRSVKKDRECVPCRSVLKYGHTRIRTTGAPPAAAPPRDAARAPRPLPSPSPSEAQLHAEGAHARSTPALLASRSGGGRGGVSEGRPERRRGPPRQHRGARGARWQARARNSTCENKNSGAGRPRGRMRPRYDLKRCALTSAPVAHPVPLAVGNPNPACARQG